jgi:hypothetical protein
MGTRGPGAKPVRPPLRLPADPPIRRQQIVSRAEALINCCQKLKVTSDAQVNRELAPLKLIS